jgi:hypothetical protein
MITEEAKTSKIDRAIEATEACEKVLNKLSTNSTWVIAISNYLTGELTQYIVKDCDSEYSAIKSAILLSCASEESRLNESFFQSSKEYPSSAEDIIAYYNNADILISAIEIKTV